MYTDGREKEDQGESMKSKFQKRKLWRERGEAVQKQTPSQGSRARDEDGGNCRIT